MSRPSRRATTLTAALALAATGTTAAVLTTASDATAPKRPVTLTVFSPRAGDHSGTGGAGFVVDLALDATSTAGNRALSAAAGYKPAFNDPMAPTFHPGPNPGAPGLVVMLSSTPTMPGTPFQGPRTNLAGLFQVNTVAKVNGRNETWNTWQSGKPLFGTGKVTLTTYVVKGTAPAVIPAGGGTRISNTRQVSFTISK